MDAGWIQVFVLTLVECVAPSGKTVCQQQEFELTFLTQADCEVALEQLVTLKDSAENVIIDKSKTRCEATARRQAVFASLADRRRLWIRITRAASKFSRPARKPRVSPRAK